MLAQDVGGALGTEAFGPLADTAGVGKAIRTTTITTAITLAYSPGVPILIFISAPPPYN
jgi:hypothetical protein